MLIKERTIWTPDNSFLLEYHARIECGEIIGGQELWQELQNLKEDFLNDAYYYDTHDAQLRIDFMERCVADEIAVLQQADDFDAVAKGIYRSGLQL